MSEVVAPSRWGSLRELGGMLLGPPFGPPPRLLTDESADPGLFGPASQTWAVAREPLVLLGGGRALLMQVADPRVAQGVLDHSDYRRDPLGRLAGTVRWLVAVTFGTTAEARAATARVHRAHRPVRGRLSSDAASARAPAGSPYSAADEDAALWVHATVVQSMLATYEMLVGPLRVGDRDRLVGEWTAVGELMGIRGDALWRDAAALDVYVDEVVSTLTGEGACTPASRRAAAVVLRPPLPTPLLRPPFAVSARLTTGLLPPRLRHAYGLRWTGLHDRAFAAAAAGSRRVHDRLPRSLRVSPVHDAALHRSEGRGLPPRR